MASAPCPQCGYALTGHLAVWRPARRLFCPECGESTTLDAITRKEVERQQLVRRAGRDAAAGIAIFGLLFLAAVRTGGLPRLDSLWWAMGTQIGARLGFAVVTLALLRVAIRRSWIQFLLIERATLVIVATLLVLSLPPIAGFGLTTLWLIAFSLLKSVRP